MDIFTCFVPGMLTLGITSGAVAGSKADQYLQLAEDVAQTCHMFYASQPSGIYRTSLTAPCQTSHDEPAGPVRIAYDVQAPACKTAAWNGQVMCGYAACHGVNSGKNVNVYQALCECGFLKLQQLRQAFGVWNGSTGQGIPALSFVKHGCQDNSVAMYNAP